MKYTGKKKGRITIELDMDLILQQLPVDVTVTDYEFIEGNIYIEVPVSGTYFRETRYEPSECEEEYLTEDEIADSIKDHAISVSVELDETEED